MPIEVEGMQYTTISWVRANQFYQMPEIGHVVSDMEMLNFCSIPRLTADPLFVRCPKPFLNWPPPPNVGKSKIESAAIEGEWRKTRKICAPILDNNDENITIEAINQTKQTEIIKQLEGNYSHSATNDTCSSRHGGALGRNWCSIRTDCKTILITSMEEGL